MMLLTACLLLSKTLCDAIKDKPVVAVAAVHASLLLVDGALTNGRREDDPVSRVFIGARPTWKTMAPAGAALVVLELYLTEKMRQSHHSLVRKLAFVPMSIGIGSQVGGIIYSLRHP